MYTITYNSGFHINFYMERYDPDMFDDCNNYFKSLYLRWNNEQRLWEVPYDRIDEIILRLVNDNREFQISDKAFSAIEEKSDRPSEIVFNDFKYDKSLLKKTPYNFQNESIEWRLSRNRYLDSLDAGLGKTFINITVLSNRFNNGDIDSALIIVPVGLSYHWKVEILESTNLFSEDDIIIINNLNKIKPFTEYQDKKIMIIPNHLLSDCVASYRKDYKKLKSYKKLRWKKDLNIKELWNKNNMFLLADESHEFKHSKSIRSKVLNSIKHNFNYRAFLSATPWINHLEHAYNQINLIDESIINMNESAFKLSIAESIGNRFSRDFINSYNEENVSKFLESIEHVFDKRLKEDIPEMKVKRITKPIYTEMHPLQIELYQKVIENEIHKLEEDYDNITWKLILNKMHLLCYAIDNPFLIKNIATDEINLLLSKWTLDKDPKFNLLKYKLQNYIENQGEKVIVFGIHPETLNMLYKEFGKYKPLIIHGSLKVKDKEKDRKEKEDFFNNSDDNSLLLASALTSSQGHNFQKKCRRVIVYESPHAQEYRQLIDRTHRITSVKNTIIEILTMANTLDNIRVQRNLNRVNFNDRLGKVISQNELSSLLRGIV